ncbi:hypothetical protein B2M26_00030 [Ferroacidibacillus organovorans]|uniref:Diguanylate cyclase n=1 Tax=Ferroacidibacillus organovorans TaxID=1765683 RepID=A0A1V4EXC2_9BACL|nr:hypothetical protein B2M26_00030 [Ferroacidibacillus organovorans]
MHVPLEILEQYRDIQSKVYRLTTFIVMNKRMDLERLCVSERLNESLFSLLNQISDAIMITDLKEMILYVNPAFTKMTGYSFMELVHRKPEMLQGAETSSETRKQIAATLRSGQAYEGEILNYRKDGRSFWNYLSISPIRDHDKQVIYYLSIQRDVSVDRTMLLLRHHTEWELAEVVALYRALSLTQQILGQPNLGVSVMDRLGELCDHLIQVLQVNLIYVGMLDRQGDRVRFLAARGRSQHYVETLQISDDENLEEGQGPAGQSLRTLGTVVANASDPSLRFWRDNLERFGLDSTLVSSARTGSGRKILLSLYRSAEHPFIAGVEHLMEAITKEIAAFFDRIETNDRLQMIQSYRDALRTFQRSLLDMNDSQAIIQTMVDVIATHTKVSCVDAFTSEMGDESLQRIHVAGPLALHFHQLPEPHTKAQLHRDGLPLPTQVWISGQKIVIANPSRDESLPSLWRLPPLSEMGVVAGWPMISPHDHSVFGVITITAQARDMFTPEIDTLIEDMVQSAALAIERVESKREMERLQQYQEAGLEAQHAFLALSNSDTIYSRFVEIMVQKTDCLASYVVIPNELGDMKIVAWSAKDEGLERVLAQSACLNTLTCESQDGLEKRNRRYDIMSWPILFANDMAPQSFVKFVFARRARMTPMLMNLLEQLMESLKSALQLTENRETLNQWAWLDPLTGISNRRALDRFLEKMNDGNESGAVIYVDLDDFKPVNDCYGHETGDLVLKEIAKRLASGLGKNDLVSRLGGDEFVMILVGLEQRSDLLERLEALDQLIQKPIDVEGVSEPLFVHASMGVAQFMCGHKLPHDVMRIADQQVYIAKNAKQDRAVAWKISE